MDRRGSDAEAVRTKQARAVSTDQLEQPLRPRRPVPARLGEARGDDDEGAHARRECLLCRIEHELSRQAFYRADDGIRDLSHRAVAVDAGHRIALPVHRVDGAGEIAAADVAEEL